MDQPTAGSRPCIAFGPELPEFGSWQWVGQDTANALTGEFETVTFCNLPPVADVVVFVKFHPGADVLRQIAARSRIVFCPVDVYGSAREIDDDWAALRLCSRIVLHTEALRPYFQSYAPVEVLSHPLKFQTSLRTEFVSDGPLLWTGNRANLAPVVEWVNRRALPAPLQILTDLPPGLVPPARELGFDGQRNDVAVLRWTAEEHRRLTETCRAAFDVKGTDFRQQHKPPAKAFDFLASGVPLAMQPDSSSSAECRRLGFLLARPEDPEHWLSRAYWERTCEFAPRLREACAPETVFPQWRTLLREVLTELPRVIRRPPPVPQNPVSPRRMRIAILSLLFNWPSTGGGTVHTAELGKFLGQAGYDVRHIYAQYEPWGLGRVTEETGVPSQALEFTEAEWHADSVRERFRAAVHEFAPDYVILTDSWNTKPLLAEAVQGYRYFLRLAALECLCPLNNVRLLPDPERGLRNCPRHQLATPEFCRTCVTRHARTSGALHAAERELAGFDRTGYAQRLHTAFAQAEGILVVNPLIGEMVKPHAQSVHVVPSGFDPDRFPPPQEKQPAPDGRIRMLFAGLIEEPMKGFHVLRVACAQLWSRRQDFELVVTGDPPAVPESFARYVGWQLQAELPRRLQEVDLLVFPTIAEEALGRSAVEAMGAGRAVVASRIGGLPYTVIDGTTGLLFEPGNATDLARQLETLLDDAPLREQLGRAGRRRFEEEFTWERIITRHYLRLFSTPAQ